jgi:hypothetical protein
MKRALVLAIAACSRRDPIASCDDDLRGVYAAGHERWMVLDNGATLEAYPLFPDGAGPGPEGALPADIVVAPRVIDFQRVPMSKPPPPAGSPGSPGSLKSPGSLAAGLPRPLEQTGLAGTLRRRYMRRAERCDGHVPVHITRCAGDTLELVLADPSPPLAYAPCTWSRPGPSRLVRWRRE